MRNKHLQTGLAWESPCDSPFYGGVLISVEIPNPVLQINTNSDSRRDCGRIRPQKYSIHDADAAKQRGNVNAITDVQLPGGGAAVHLDGLLGDIQFLGDFFVLEPLGNKLHHFFFARGQRLKGRPVRVIALIRLESEFVLICKTGF